MQNTNHKKRETKILALTGGIASGKTTVAKRFQKYGAIVINADKIAHQTYRRSTAVYDAIVKRYGSKVLGAKQQISRAKLANILFHSPREKKWLQNKIHPETRKLIAEKLKKALSRKPVLILVEAALHVETGYYRHFQGMIVIKTSLARQIKWLMKRDKLSRAEALARIKNQMPLAKKLRLADFVIDNSDTLLKTTRQVKKLMQYFQKTP